MSAAEPMIPVQTPTQTPSAPAPAAPPTPAAPAPVSTLKFAENPGAPGTPPKVPEHVTLPPWMGELDADSIAYAKGKGWLAEGKAFADVVKAHRAAESYIGKPADQIMSKVDWKKPESVAEYRAAMGVPEAAEGYKPVDTKLPEGMIDTAQVAAISHKLSLSQAQHEAFVGETAAFFTESIRANAQDVELRNAAALVTWTKAKGNALEASNQAVQSAILANRITEDQFAALEISMGTDGAREFLIGIHERTGEHPSPGAGDQGFRITTPEVAQAEIQRLGSDPQFLADQRAGGDRARTANERLNALHAIAWS